MLSHSENSRKQEIHHHPPNPFPPPKVWQLWQLWQFSAPTPTSLSLEVTYNIYKYIYNKLNIIITIWKQPEFIYPSPENCHNCHNCHNCNAPSSSSPFSPPSSIFVKKSSILLNPPALDLFYRSKTCTQLHDKRTGLYLMSNGYIADDFIYEKQRGY